LDHWLIVIDVILLDEITLYCKIWNHLYLWGILAWHFLAQETRLSGEPDVYRCLHTSVFESSMQHSIWPTNDHFTTWWPFDDPTFYYPL